MERKLVNPKKTSRIVNKGSTEINSALTLTKEANNIKNLEEGKTYSIQEFQEILAQADALQVYEQDLSKNSRLNELPDEFQEAKMLREESLFRAADQLMIEPKYIKKALELKVTPEQAINDLSDFNAIPSFDVVRNTYKNVLLNSLKFTFPFMEFSALTDGYDTAVLNFSMEIKKTIKMRNIFLRSYYGEIKETEKLAEINLKQIRETIDGFIGSNYTIDFYSPLFLKACKKDLKQLDNYFRKVIPRMHKLKANYYYNPGLEEVINGDFDK
ncbi:MAG: hypothetical protein WC781_04815 [Candidatus Pacearchaeota archaeon]